MVTKGYPYPAQALTFQQVFQTTDEIIRRHSRTFFFATQLLPKRERQAIRSLYAFCRSTDDLVDRGGASLKDLEAWRAQVRRPAHEQQQAVLISWSTVREQYPIDRRYEEELIDGVARDLVHHRYASWSELQTYCYKVASTVGLLSMPIIGLAPGVCFETPASFAIQLGIALQLTNILRDVGEDAAQGRVYLPQEDLAAFGLNDQDILSAVYDERFIALMRFEIARARSIYRQALPGIGMLNPKARAAVGAAALLYRAILDEIEMLHYRVHQHRAHTSGLRKLAMLPGILVTVYNLKPLA